LGGKRVGGVGGGEMIGSQIDAAGRGPEYTQDQTDVRCVKTWGPGGEGERLLGFKKGGGGEPAGGLILSGAVRLGGCEAAGKGGKRGKPLGQGIR